MATPLLLLLLAWGAVIVEAPVAVPVTLILLATALGYIALFDFAVAVDVDDTGITRRCLLRRQHMPWGEIEAVVKPRRRGLIVVTRDRRRRILLDRGLEEDELNRLRSELKRRNLRADF